jgi:XTP/dITP diphosphohydrolase
MKLKFITSNAAKVDLAKERLSRYNIDPIQETIELDENRSMEVEEVARYKAEQALKKLKEQFIIEDSAFYIESLGGFPGTYIKMAFDCLGDERIVSLVGKEKNKRAYTKSVLVYGDPKTGDLKFFIGIYEGTIAKVPKGTNMRGWKVVKIFIPKGWGKTLAELNDSEWQEFLNKFRKSDHFEQFAKWATKNLLSTKKREILTSKKQ